MVSATRRACLQDIFLPPLKEEKVRIIGFGISVVVSILRMSTNGAARLENPAVRADGPVVVGAGRENPWASQKSSGPDASRMR
jgi:hypothetical protein